MESLPSKDNHMACAARVPIFSTLSRTELENVASLLSQKVYPSGSLIIQEGIVPPSFIIVCKGKIKIFSHSQDGKEQIMYILTGGDFFGARNLLHEKEADYNAMSMEESLICSIERKDFRQLISRYPEMGLKIMDVLCSRLEKMEALVRKISPKDVDARISLMLLELSEKYGREYGGGILVELPMNREEMANYIGVARETISRKLTMLKEEGIIDIKGNKKLLILKEEELERLV